MKNDSKKRNPAPACEPEEAQTDKEREEETAHYIRTLEENKQVSRKPGPLSPGETHRETVDEKGEKRVKRERFSAF